MLGLDCVEDSRDRRTDGFDQTQEQKTQCRSCDADEQHRAAAIAVGEAAQERRAEELRQGIDRDEKTDKGRSRPVGFGVKRQQRQDQPEAQQVNEDDQEDIRETAFLHDVSSSHRRGRDE